MSVMTKRKRQDESPPKTTGRDNFRYVGLPVALWEELKAFADADERSVNFVVKKAVREYLDRHQKTPAKS